VHELLVEVFDGGEDTARDDVAWTRANLFSTWFNHDEYVGA